VAAGELPVLLTLLVVAEEVLEVADEDADDVVLEFEIELIELAIEEAIGVVDSAVEEPAEDEAAAATSRHICWVSFCVAKLTLVSEK